MFSASELSYQLKRSNTTFVICHSSNIATALSATRLLGLPPERVILMDQCTSRHYIPCVEDLIQNGLKQEIAFEEYILDPGEGRRKVALLSWSSGTTGKPKVRGHL